MELNLAEWPESFLFYLTIALFVYFVISVLMLVMKRFRGHKAKIVKQFGSKGIVVVDAKPEPKNIDYEKVKKVLKITDDLLEKLPKDVINEFVNSKDFELYKEVVKGMRK